MDLHGKVVLVTGGSRGVGRGIVASFCGAGCIVYVSARPDPTKLQLEAGESLEQLADRLNREHSGACIPVRCDHADERAVRTLFERIQKSHDRLDILINNVYSASTACASLYGTTFDTLESPCEVFDEFMNVGLRNHFLCCVLGARLMKRSQSKGLIVTISSEGGGKFVFNPLYGVQKAACDRLMSDIAIELKPFGITAISYWPGAVETELVKRMLETTKDEAIHSLFERPESVAFVGQCVLAMARDPDRHRYTGQIRTSTTVAAQLGLRDAAGNIPVRPQHVELGPLIDVLNQFRTSTL